MPPASPYPHETPPTGAAAGFAASLQSRLPRLQTNRLTLRAPRAEDFQPNAGVHLSPDFPHVSATNAATATPTLVHAHQTQVPS